MNEKQKLDELLQADADAVNVVEVSPDEVWSVLDQWPFQGRWIIWGHVVEQDHEWVKRPFDGATFDDAVRQYFSRFCTKAELDDSDLLLLTGQRGEPSYRIPAATLRRHIPLFVGDLWGDIFVVTQDSRWCFHFSDRGEMSIGRLA